MMAFRAGGRLDVVRSAKSGRDDYEAAMLVALGNAIHQKFALAAQDVC